MSHQDQKVSVISENNEKTSGTVKCIDEFGYIMVELPNGEFVSLQPGKNSFDMIQLLIHIGEGLFQKKKTESSPLLYTRR